MKITSEEARRLAMLARLDLSEDDLQTLTGQLDSILGYMDKLNELDTDEVEPMSHAVDVVNAMRPDRAVNRPRTEELLGNAPDREHDFIRVPKIIE